MAKTKRSHISQNQKTKKRKPVTSFTNINIPLYQDASTKIVKIPNQPIWHVYKNGKFDMAMYSAKDNDSGEQDSIINNIGKALTPKLRNILTKYHNIPIDVNKEQYHDIGFLYSKKKILHIPTTKIDNKANETILKSCVSRYRFIPKNICTDISVNENYKMKSTKIKEQIYYYIDALLLWSDDTSACHSLSGKQHVLIIEDYLKTQYHNLPIIGELSDAAHNYKNDMCDKLHEYIEQGKLTQEFLLELLNKHIRSYISLSTLTVFKTGLTYYEKMGYMRVGNKEKSSALTYYKLFNAFCDDILRRVERVFMPISAYITHNKGKGARAYKEIKDKFALVKLILHELLPATKFTLETLQDLYKLIDVSVYSVDFFCLNQANIPKAILLYYILRVNVKYILDDAIEDLHNDDTQSYKHLQLEPTAENKFILAQHSLIPGIGKEYMGIMLPGPVTGVMGPKKQKEINDKVTKVLTSLEKLNGKQ